MLKNIKKSLKYFVIILGVMLLLPGTLYILAQIPEVQTFMIKRITNHFSEQIKSTISVGSIEYKFFNRLTATDIIIKDQHNDTLMYSKRLTVGIRGVNFRKQSFRFGKISFVNPVFNLITDSTGLSNLTWYLNMLKSEPDSSKKGSTHLSVDHIDIDNARFSLINENGQKGNTKIDFNNLHISSINGIIEEFKISNDTTSFNINNLNFNEGNGFRAKKINSSVKIARQDILLRSNFIMLDSSIMNMPRIEIFPDSSGSLKNFVQNVKLNVRFEKSLINTSDFQYFIPFIDSMRLNESVWFSGNVTGTIAELRGRNIKLSYRNHTSLDCDFDFSGLPKIENTYLYIGVNSLKTSAKDIEHLKTGKGPIILPDIIKKLGTISFNGNFTGFTTDFITYGEIRTILGNLRTDISLRPEESGKYKIKGLIKGTNINLGELTGKPELLGNLNMNANVDGYAYSLKQFSASLTGRVDSVEINKYLYRNISLNGSFTEKTWDGSISINDSNIKFDLLGLLSFKNELPEFDCTLNLANANLYKLNFDKPDSTSNVSALLTANFKGTNIDNLDGEIKLLNSKFRKFGRNLELYDFSIKTFKENHEPALRLRTDFIDADIKGYYNFSTLASLFKSTLAGLMPSQFHFIDKNKDFRKNKFKFDINFRNTDKINEFFRTGIVISDKSYIKGEVLTDSIINISGKADLLSVKNNDFQNFSFDANVSGGKLALDIKSSSLSLLKQSELKDFSIGLHTVPDNFIFRVNWNNKDTVLNTGNFVARGKMEKRASAITGSTLKIDIDSSDIYSDNSLWRLKKSMILIDSNAIDIDKFVIAGNNRSYTIDGKVSVNPEDTLHLEFKGIDVSPLSYIINRKNENDPNNLHLDLKGNLNGKLIVTNVYKNLQIFGNVAINNFSMIGTEFGNLSVISELDNTTKKININAVNTLKSSKIFDIAGAYDPSARKIELDFNAKKMPIGFLNTLLKSFASDINGTASGHLKFVADNGDMTLTGAIIPENATLKVNYLQTKYSIKDSVKFNNEGFKFNNIKIYDIKGNNANLSGAVYHKNFKNYSANLTINITSSNFQVLNTQIKDNPLFYGTVYGSGVAKMKIDQNYMSFDISARTGKNSKMSIPLSKGLSVSEYSYISFDDSGKGKPVSKQDNTSPASSTQPNMLMDLNMNLEVTNDAEIQIIFDEKLGDIMKGNGRSENLNINLNKKGDFKISGLYTVNRGDYNFTLGPIINKPFSVEDGGKITFNGDLKDAEIDLKASYLNLKTSLAPILEDFSSSERVSVEPQLNLSGKLFNPVVGFDIYLPNADEETRTRLKNAITTQEELTRQVSALLMLNSFIATGTYSPGTNTATSAVAATSFEMVSNEMSNMLSKISKNVDIGLNIRPGSNTITPQEAELALSTQILNNKVVLNGNFDVRGTTTNSYANSNSTNQLTGDFDAEVKLTEKLRFKVFNRFNDTYYTSGLSPYTQGVGIFFTQDFNRFSDLLRKKAKQDHKKEEEKKAKEKK